VAITGSPVTDVATTAGSKLQVWWKRAASAAETSVAVPDSGDHQVAAIFTFRGCIPTGNPWNVATTGTKTTASTTATVPSLTTTVPDTLVVAVVGRPDDSASTTHFGTLTNANLTGIGAGGEAGTTSGHGGGFCVEYGTFAGVGSTGTSTLSKTASTTDTYMALALRAAASLTSSTGSFAVTGIANAFKRALKVVGSAGVITETGVAANLLRKYSLTASVGSFAEVGKDASFIRTLKLVSAVGSFSEVGEDATFKRTYSLAAASGSFSEVGNPATLKRTYTLAGLAGAFSETGQAATLSRSYSLSANAGSFAEVGQAATLTRGLKLTATPNIVTSGLALNLDAGNTASYPGSGTTWTDLSGNGNNGTLISGPTFDSANGGSIVFDGTNDYVNFSTYSQPPYLTTTSFTWSIWLLYFGSSAGNGVILGSRAGATSEFTKLTPTNFEYYPNNTGNNIPSSVWVNITLVKNGTTLLYYQNNILVASNSSSQEKPSKPFYIASDPSSGEYFGGKISTVSVYNRALSAAEVAQNFNTLRGRYGI
jgi:hypothetical protein